MCVIPTPLVPQGLGDPQSPAFSSDPRTFFSKAWGPPPSNWQYRRTAGTRRGHSFCPLASFWFLKVERLSLGPPRLSPLSPGLTFMWKLFFPV